MSAEKKSKEMQVQGQGRGDRGELAQRGRQQRPLWGDGVRAAASVKGSGGPGSRSSGSESHGNCGFGFEEAVGEI